MCKQHRIKVKAVYLFVSVYICVYIFCSSSECVGMHQCDLKQDCSRINQQAVNSQQIVLAGHGDILLKSLHSFREKSLFFDTELQLDNRVLLAHSIVLAAYSGYFADLVFKQDYNGTSNKLCINLPDSQLSFSAMQWVLDFMYTGKVHLPITKSVLTINMLIEACTILDVKNLRMVLVNHSKSVSNSRDVENSDHHDGPHNNHEAVTLAEMPERIARKSLRVLKKDVVYVNNESDQESNERLPLSNTTRNENEAARSMQKKKYLKKLSTKKKGKLKHGNVNSKQSLSQGRKLKSNSTLSDEQLKNNKVFKCTESGCQYQTINRGSMKYHRRRHAGIMPHNCNYCDKAFVDKKSLKCHETTHTGEKNHKCNFCNHKFAIRKSLVEHIKNVHADIKNPFICPHSECEFAAATNKDLYSHRLESHRTELMPVRDPDDPLQKYVCPTCGKQCRSRYAAKLHQKVHTQAGLFKCDHCDFSCAMKQSLKAHLNRIHNKELDGSPALKPFCCEACGISYFTVHELTVHMRREHTNERPFSCKYCDFKTTQKGNLIRHERLHTGERPFECSLCNKTFVAQSGLARHKRAHAGIKPHRCNHCGQSFAERKNLVRHAKKIHPEFDPPPKLTPSEMQRHIKEATEQSSKKADIPGSENFSTLRAQLAQESPTTTTVMDTVMENAYTSEAYNMLSNTTHTNLASGNSGQGQLEGQIQGQGQFVDPGHGVSNQGHLGHHVQVEGQPKIQPIVGDQNSGILDLNSGQAIQHADEYAYNYQYYMAPGYIIAPQQ